MLRLPLRLDEKMISWLSGDQAGAESVASCCEAIFSRPVPSRFIL